MRARCPKCKAVFEVPMGLSIMHVGPWRYTKCPACGKSNMMNNFISDPVTWPESTAEKVEGPPMSSEDLMKKRLEDSKFEEKEG